jgi:hypothetical protein
MNAIRFQPSTPNNYLIHSDIHFGIVLQRGDLDNSLLHFLTKHRLFSGLKI